MAAKLPSNDFMFPDLIDDCHVNGKTRIYDRVTGQIFPGYVCAMREGEYIVEVRRGETPKYILHEGHWATAHVR